MAFIDEELEMRGHHPGTVKEKLRKLSEVYAYWQDDPAFPHEVNYNPFELAATKASFETPSKKELPRISVAELRDRLQSATNIRDEALIVTQLKLGLRATEVCNLQLSEVSIQNHEVQRHYPEMGMHPIRVDRENALFVPHDRSGNKSQRSRVLPLDDEMRRTLIRCLLIRPDSGVPWLFLSKRGHCQLRQKVLSTAWKEVFHPKYAETEQHRAVTSHYGRHRFTTYWSVE